MTSPPLSLLSNQSLPVAACGCGPECKCGPACPCRGAEPHDCDCGR